MEISPRAPTVLNTPMTTDYGTLPAWTVRLLVIAAGILIGCSVAVLVVL